VLYHAYEMTHAAMGPLRTWARMSNQALLSPMNPFAMFYPSRATAADGRKRIPASAARSMEISL